MWYYRIIFGEGAVLNENAKAALEELFELAKQVKKIVLVGHYWPGSYADADKSALAHEAALARAAVVREEFVKAGISPDKIEIGSNTRSDLHATEIYLYRHFDASMRHKLILPKLEIPEYVWHYYFNAIKREDFEGYCPPYRLYWCGQPTYQIKMKRSFLGRIINLWRERAYIKEKKQIWPLAMASLLSEKYYLVTSMDVQLITAKWQRSYSLNHVHATPYSISNGVGNIKIFYESYNPECDNYYEMVWEKVANPEKVASFINALASRRINGS